MLRGFFNCLNQVHWLTPLHRGVPRLRKIPYRLENRLHVAYENYKYETNFPTFCLQFFHLLPIYRLSTAVQFTNSFLTSICLITWLITAKSWLANASCALVWQIVIANAVQIKLVVAPRSELLAPEDFFMVLVFRLCCMRGVFEMVLYTVFGGVRVFKWHTLCLFLYLSIYEIYGFPNKISRSNQLTNATETLQTVVTVSVLRVCDN